MGAKTWMLVLAESNAREALSENPRLDRAATEHLAGLLFAGEKLTPLTDGDLSSTCPPNSELVIGCFAGAKVVAAREFAIDYPSRLARRFIDAAGNGIVTLHAMHSVVDWFAYGIWESGTLVRSLSVSPDNGVMEDIGSRLPFEEPYWAGQLPVVGSEDDKESYPLPFHPLELGEAALLALLGYTLEGYPEDCLFDPETIPLLRFKRSRASWWKFW